MCRARRRGPRTPLRTTDTSLHFAFVENSLVFVVPNIGGGCQAPLGHPIATPLITHSPLWRSRRSAVHYWSSFLQEKWAHIPTQPFDLTFRTSTTVQTHGFLDLRILFCMLTLIFQYRPQISNQWWMLKSVYKGFGTAKGIQNCLAFWMKAHLKVYPNPG